MKLLLLEDDDLLAESLAESLKDNGYLVDVAPTVKAATSFMATEEYALAILDIGLPDGSGLELLAHWRKQKRATPILILTARDTWEDKVVGLETGADDYLTKPYDLRELALRCEALSRRPELHRDSLLIEGGLRVDMRAMTAHWQQTLIPLTGIGLKLLSELLVAHPYPVSRSDLISAIWSTDPPESNALKSHIYSLRKVLEHVSGRQLLFTISNVGYQLKGLD